MAPRPTILGFVTPMLPTLVDEPPSGDQWVHEIKYDGYRTELVIDSNGPRAFTRNGYDWTERYRTIVASARVLRCKSAIIDGEMCVQNAKGVTDFGELRRSIKTAPEHLVLFAFDLLYLDGRDLGPIHSPIAAPAFRIWPASTPRPAFISAKALLAREQPSSGRPMRMALRGSCRSEPTAAM